MNIHSNEKKHIIDFLFTLATFTLFVVCSIFVVLLGARCYEKVFLGMNENFTARTTIAYMSEKLRQRDVIGCANITTIEGTTAITLMRQSGAQVERTYIYSDDGYLKELNVTEDDVELHLADGQKLIELKDFEARKISNSIYYISLTDLEGNTEYTYISTKCGDDVKGNALAGPQ